MNGIVPKDNDIAFENIDFSYEKDEFKMKKLSFSIAEKTMTALVGESGSKKTTITNFQTLAKKKRLVAQPLPIGLVC